MWKEALASQLTCLSSQCPPASQLLPTQESIVNYQAISSNFSNARSKMRKLPLGSGWGLSPNRCLMLLQAMLYQCWVEISGNRSFLCKNVIFAECVLSLYISALWGLISPDGSIAQVTCSMLKEHLLKMKWTLSIAVRLCTLSHAYLIRTAIHESFCLLWLQFSTIVFDISNTLCTWTISSATECPLGPIQHWTTRLNYTHGTESTRKGEAVYHTPVQFLSPRFRGHSSIWSLQETSGAVISLRIWKVSA